MYAYFGHPRLVVIFVISVSDPSHFDVDPDPGPKWIWIRIRVPIFHIFLKEIHVGQIKMLIFITAKI